MRRPNRHAENLVVRPNKVDADHGLDLVTEATPADVQTVLVIARGIGGFTSAMVLTASQ